LKKGPPAARDTPGSNGDGPIAFHSETSKTLSGFLNEIKDIRPSTVSGNESDIPEYMSRSSNAVREAMRYFYVLFLIFWGIVQTGGRAVGAKLPILRRRATAPGWFSLILRILGVRPYGVELTSLYRQLRQAQDDPMDEDFQPDEAEAQEESSSSESESDSEGERTDRERSRSRSVSVHPQDLYSDLLETSAELSSSDQSDLNNILLSHLASPYRITRNTYSQMVLSPLQALAKSQGGSPGKEVDPARMEQLETQLLCVVCRADVRRIICWPCRALPLAVLFQNANI
jgi:hypothetical protein